MAIHARTYIGSTQKGTIRARSVSAQQSAREQSMTAKQDQEAYAAARYYLDTHGHETIAAVADKFNVNVESLKVRIARVRLVRALDR
jgi:hypothetical protein